MQFLQLGIKMQFKITVMLSLIIVGGTFSSAELNEEMKSDGRERRDFASFQKQIQDLLPFNINNTTLCPTPPCIGALDPSWCTGFCSSSFGAIRNIYTSLISCYVNGFCGTNFVTRTVYDVNVPIATSQYAGKCSLSGQKVTFTFNLTSMDVKNLDSKTASYVNNVVFTYVFNGLSISCLPPTPPATCPPPPTPANVITCPPPPPPPTTNCPQNGGGQQCCSNNLLTQLLCLVQNLLSALSLQISLVDCNCRCSGGAFLGKREAAESSVNEREPDEWTESTLSKRQAEGFRSPVVVTLTETYKSYIVFRSPLDPIQDDGGVRLATNVNLLGDGVPQEFRDELVSGITSVFSNYNIYYYLLYYYNAIIWDLVFSFSKTCPTCS